MICIDLLDVSVEDKAELLRLGTANAPERIFHVDAGALSCVPGSPFAYWASDELRSTFATHPPFEYADRTAKVGVGRR